MTKTVWATFWANFCHKLIWSPWSRAKTRLNGKRCQNSVHNKHKIFVFIDRSSSKERSRQPPPQKNGNECKHSRVRAIYIFSDIFLLTVLHTVVEFFYNSTIVVDCYNFTIFKLHSITQQMPALVLATCLCICVFILFSQVYACMDTFVTWRYQNL
jgi:hypothetical protein